jgi:hypothetical protein
MSQPSPKDQSAPCADPKNSAFATKDTKTEVHLAPLMYAGPMMFVPVVPPEVHARMAFYGDHLCIRCQRGENYLWEWQNGAVVTVRAICGVCQSKLSRSPFADCDGGKPNCRGHRYVNAMAEFSPFCNHCAKSGAQLKKQPSPANNNITYRLKNIRTTKPKKSKPAVGGEYPPLSSSSSCKK